MILLDTNVLSELMRPNPNTSVVTWIDNLPNEDIWISSITVGEIRLGLALLPEGHRKQMLSSLADFLNTKPPVSMQKSFLHEVVMGDPFRLKMHKLQR